jgi:hypothetical protein
MEESIRQVVFSFVNGNSQSFNSHDFINKLILEDRNVYDDVLEHFHGRRALAHAYFANYLRYHTEDLGITRDASKAMTFNVNSNISASRIWNH